MERERPPTFISLADDVKAHIMSFLCPCDAISLSCTCKAVHAISINPALHTVVLNGSPEQIMKFRDFLSTEPRPRFLKSLTLTKAVTLDIDHTTTQPASALADILEKATGLEHFSCGTFEAFIQASNDRISSALSSLNSLTELTLSDGASRTIKVISSLSSSYVRRLRLSTTGMVFLGDLFHSLTRYPHIETFLLRGLFTTPPSFAAPIALPSMRTFSFESLLEDPRSIRLGAIPSFFPNLQRFTFRTHRPSRRRPALAPTSSTSWEHTLAEAHIDTIDLDLWPLSSRVRWLDLDLIPPGLSDDALAAVDRTKPRLLSCAYRIDPDNLFWVRLPTIATDLRYLEARVLELSGARKRYMLLHLARFPALTAIFLCLRVYHHPGADRDAELDELARSLAARNRGLRFVGISLTDGRSVARDNEPMWDEECLGARWWAVTRRDEESRWAEEEADVSVTIIPTEVGMKVRAYMYEADFETPGWEERLSAFV